MIGPYEGPSEKDRDIAVHLSQVFLFPLNSMSQVMKDPRLQRYFGHDPRDDLQRSRGPASSE